jgi:hypothetical protein
LLPEALPGSVGVHARTGQECEIGLDCGHEGFPHHAFCFLKSKLRFLPDGRQLAGLFSAFGIHIFVGRVGPGFDALLCSDAWR